MSMTTAKPITIIGGGLAGLTLGIALRQRSVLVTIIEAGHYPRHRVCGEFISGNGQATLSRMGLSETLTAAGAISAKTISFHSDKRGTPPRSLPSPAICLSRYALDATLAQKFQSLGGELRCGQRVSNVEQGEGIVRANGRVPSTNPNDERWFGLKIHARKVTPQADLEMHFSARGYVGICRLNNDEVNICGLFRKTVGDDGETKNHRELLRGFTGSPWHERLAKAEFDETSFCAVAGLSLAPRLAIKSGRTCIGDAITMIPPVTGNGMSMAFESAELAIAPLTEWSRGTCAWPEAQRRIAVDCDRTFHRRLRAAQWLQRLVLTPSFQNPLVALGGRADWFWRMAFEHTR
jgi:2-polyprenyl-6-methoxyphenol hydroxylase-like FAD-dependent oxidoreductase